jgi:CubicO group peptidase (beta-lactamase class C family)
MRKKILGICICALLIGAFIIPVSSRTSVSSIRANNDNNPDEILSENFSSFHTNHIFSDGLDDLIMEEMTMYHVPGLSASVVKNKEPKWTRTYGYANLSQNLPVKNTTLFMLASVSKTITATAIMQLYDQGFFNLDDPINDYLPFLVLHPDFPSISITFRMLLTHSSSIEDNWGVMPYYIGDPIIPLGEYLEDYLTVGGAYYDPVLNFYAQEPGSAYHYSNIAVALVGYLVEVISGMSFREYCKLNIFEPLDMNETAWFLADLNVSHIAVPYHWDGYHYTPYPHYSFSDYPAGQLRTSVTQLSHFLLMMMNNGEYNSTQILKPTTVTLMLSSQLPFHPSQGIIWYRIIQNGRTLWGHSGGSLGVRTEMYFEPATNMGAIYLTNGEHVFVHLISALFDFAEHSPPDAPTIEGSSKEKIKIATEFNFTAIDPDNDEVYYFIDWGDGNYTDWIGPYVSGETVTVNHSWNETGMYSIRAKAKDEFYNMESTWSNPFYMTITAPLLTFGDVVGGFSRVCVEIKNSGNAAATNLDWDIVLEGKLMLLGQSTSGLIEILGADAEVAIKSTLIFGFGRIIIIVTVACDEGITAEILKYAFVLGPFILGMK